MPILRNWKHEHFVQEVLAGNTQKDAYTKVYPQSNPNSSKRNGSRLMHRQDVQERCKDILNSQKDMTLDVQLRRLSKLSKANKQVVVDKMLTDVADNPTRLEATKTFLRLHGLMTTNDHQVNGNTSNTLNIVVGQEGIKHLGSILGSLKGMRNRSDLVEGDVINPDKAPSSDINHGKS